MAVYKTQHAAGTKQSPNPMASTTHVVRFVLAGGGIALTPADVVQLGLIPSGFEVEDFVIDSDAAAVSGTFTFDVGLLNAAGTALDTADANNTWVAGSDLAQCGGIARMSDTKALRSRAAGKMLGLIANAAGTTAAGKQLGVTVRLRAR